MTSASDRPIGLGDLIRALHILEPTEEEAKLIGGLLGVVLKDGPAQAAPKKAAQRRDARPDLASRRWPSLAPRFDNGGVQPEETLAPSPPLGGLTCEELPAADPAYPTWMPSQGIPIRAPSSGTKVARPRLFAARKTRGLLQAILATRVATDELDVARMIDHLAARRSVADLPRLTAWSLRRGVQVLVDHGDGMLPFLLDAEDLVARLRDTASSELVQLRYFRGDPSFILSETSLEPLRYEPPPSGTPVLMISDLGIGRRSGKSFFGFARRLRERGYSLTAVVPYPRERWPARLDSLMTIVPWDRYTDLRTIRIRRTRRG